MWRAGVWTDLGRFGLGRPRSGSLLGPGRANRYAAVEFRSDGSAAFFLARACMQGDTGELARVWGLVVLTEGRRRLVGDRSVAVSFRVDGFHVARTRGTTRRTQRFERRGLNMGDLGSQQNTVTEASSRQTHNALQRETPRFTQVQGPCGEGKPLLPAFLYHDAIPREEYKVLITEL
jgi:hypothetical protein